MCLYPKLIINPKYRPNKKNGGKAPTMEDERVKYVPIGCGKCIECRRKKKREWQIRLQEELKTDSTGKFVTLTFSEESLQELVKENKINEGNAIATIAVRRYLERHRKKYKKSIKHWLITEMGHNNTERIHLHGIIFTKQDNKEIEKLWKYGQIWVGTFCNEQTINYIIKYVTKVDEDHKGFEPVILCSPGIGKNYTTRQDAIGNKYNGKETKEYYRLKSGAKSSLPIYYRNKIYSEDEREKLWLQRLDEETRYVDGIKIDVSKDLEQYEKVLKKAQERNKRLGYGDDSKEWSKREYNVKLNEINKIKRYKGQKELK